MNLCPFKTITRPRIGGGHGWLLFQTVPYNSGVYFGMTFIEQTLDNSLNKLCEMSIFSASLHAYQL